MAPIFVPEISTVRSVWMEEGVFICLIFPVGLAAFGAYQDISRSRASLMEMAEMQDELPKFIHKRHFWLRKTCQYVVKYANSKKWSGGLNSSAKAWPFSTR